MNNNISTPQSFKVALEPISTTAIIIALAKLVIAALVTAGITEGLKLLWSLAFDSGRLQNSLPQSALEDIQAEMRQITLLGNKSVLDPSRADIYRVKSADNFKNIANILEANSSLVLIKSPRSEEALRNLIKNLRITSEKLKSGEIDHIPAPIDLNIRLTFKNLSPNTVQGISPESISILHLLSKEEVNELSDITKELPSNLSEEKVDELILNYAEIVVQDQQISTSPDIEKRIHSISFEIA